MDPIGYPMDGTVDFSMHFKYDDQLPNVDVAVPVQDAFLLPFNTESENSFIELSASRRSSGNNTNSYYRMGGLSAENSRNAILFTYENSGDKELPNQGESSGEASFTCPHCNRQFKKKFVFKVHLRSHTGKPYQCMVCGRAFAQKSNCKKHIERHKIYPHLASKNGIIQPSSSIHIDQILNPTSAVSVLGACAKNKTDTASAFGCPYCEELFHCHKCVNTHMRKHEDKKVFQCPMRTCGELFQNLEDFLSHLPTHNNGLTYDCPICGRVYDSISDVGVHQCAHVILGEKRGLVRRSCRCLTCGDIFRSLKSLEKHYAQSSHQHECVRCKRVYTSSRRLRKHLKTHQPNSKFVCARCKKVFAFSWTLKYHQKNAHESSGTGFACSQCSKTFKRRDVLQRHEISVHSPVAQYRCSFDGCGKSFKRQDRLKEHVLTHGDVKKHKCQICGKSFNRLQAYKQHVKSIHEKTYRFRCDSCQKGFNRPDKYERHKAKCKK